MLIHVNELVIYRHFHTLAQQPTTSWVHINRISFWTKSINCAFLPSAAPRDV